MDRKLFALLIALVAIVVLAIPLGVMAQESPDTEVPPEAEHCLAQGFGALSVRGIWVCTPPSIAQVTTATPIAMATALPSMAQATEELELVLTAEQAEWVILNALEPALPDCTDDFLSGQLISFLRTEEYEMPDLNQWGFKLRQDLSEGLIVYVNTCEMLRMSGLDGRILYDFAGWSVYDGTEVVNAAYDGVPTTFWWSAQGVVHQGDVIVGPVEFTFTGPQAFTAGAFVDNVRPGFIPIGPVLGGPDCVLAFQAGAEGAALQTACLSPVALASASANR